MTDELVMGNRAGGVPRPSAESPSPTACTGETLAVIHCRGLVELQRHGDVRDATLEPVHTVRAGGQHHALVMRNNTARGDQGQMCTPDHEPMRALTTRGHQSLILPYARTGVAAVAGEEPSPTLTTRDRLALVVPYATGNDATDSETEPMATTTTHAKAALVQTVWDDDDIDACRFRMFALHEIAGAMVMHRHTDGGAYPVLGNKREQMAQYGNSVTPPAMAWLVARLLEVVQGNVFVDLFCGAGGSSLGAELAGARLALGLNHWARAVETHAANFQHAEHDCEDIASLSTARIRRYLAFAKADILIGGPECTNHSIAKGGKRRKPQVASLLDEGPAGDDEQDKSRATMWDMVRFAEQAILTGHPFKAIVVENVVDAFKWGANDDGGLFNAWLTAIDALGYRHEIVWLNSMFAPPAPDAAPQSRDRMYVVFWRKGIRRPNLRVEPPAWCPSCEKIVAGQQTWKRPDRRPWGRYGAQYLYACPDCHNVTLPGAFPAATIIDPELPAERIGDRQRPLAKNTRERIRRGLERLEREPFAIRLTHGGTPRPLTLPLVTLTQRHDPAVVFPVSGNTYETSPGNRAKRAGEHPLATVHGTLDRAIVVPPMGQVTPRPAATAPSPTQTGTTRAAIVTQDDA